MDIGLILFLIIGFFINLTIDLFTGGLDGLFGISGDMMEMMM